MENPWLHIPLEDLEGHLAHPAVAQAQLLSDIFADALHRFSPPSVAVLGCAGGNGFDRIDEQVTTRVVAIDLNPLYIQETKRRFSKTIPHLELVAGDIQRDDFAFAPVDLVFIALLFEHVDVEIALAKIRLMLNVNGRMVTFVQLPDKLVPEVTPTPYTSIRTLSSIMRLVSPEYLKSIATVHGLRQMESRIVTVAGGKKFQVQVFQR